MASGHRIDCVVIGYNESPFEVYEQMLGNYGTDSEAYRDLQFSFIDTDSGKMNYVGLLNHAVKLAQNGSASPGQEFISGEIPNLAAVYLTNFMKLRGFRADYVNLFQYEKDRLRDLLSQNPYCIAITTTFYVWNFPVSEMVEFIRNENPEVKIVVGGPLVANHCRNFDGEQLAAALSDIGADIFVDTGQGETALANITSCLQAGGDLAKVPNILYFEGSQLCRTPVVLENNCLNENYIRWTAFGDRDLGATIQTRTARSCAFKCAFCNYPARAGKLSLATVDTIEKELDEMVALGGVRNVVFIDDTFNVPLPRFKNICRMMIRKGYGFNWFSYFRCSNSDEEAVELMAESGCKGVFLGIESGSPTVLQHMAKAATIEKYARGIGLLRQAGILTFGSFITGFPGETADTVEETLSFIKEYQPDYFRSQLWYCEAGTPIELQREKFQIEGEGFVWSHATMDSLEAMDHIDRMFLSVDRSEWLPQWSFDFWIIPYLMGKDISLDSFRRFMSHANNMLRLEIADVARGRKQALQREHMRGMVDTAKGWPIVA
ncbi:MAG: PhpK family radical SAM P-methyltransferase [Acidobacteriota bacterium]